MQRKKLHIRNLDGVNPTQTSEKNRTWKTRTLFWPNQVVPYNQLLHQFDEQHTQR